MERLDHLITKELQPEALQGLDDSKLQELSYRLDEITELVSTNLKLEPFSGKSSDILELEIQGYQSGLIRLMDVLNRYLLSGNTLNQKHTNIYSFATRKLDTLLSFIEQHLAKYFSVDEKVPEIYVQHNRAGFAARLKEIESSLVGRLGADELITIATEPLRDFVGHKADAYTFRQLIYLKELIALLHGVEKLNKDASTYPLLIEKLVYINFNSVDFINHFTASIKATVKPLATIDQKIEKLSWHLKEVSQMHIKPDFQLDASLPSVKEKVKLWLIEEIRHCRRLQSPEAFADIETLSVTEKQNTWLWTASKTDLVELLYGIFYTSAINYGAPKLKEIAGFLEETFNISLKDFYRTYLQIRYRKNRTTFLDKMKRMLEEKMDELDEQADMYT